MSPSYRIFLEQPAIPQYLTPLINLLNDRLGDRLRVAFGAQHQGTRSDPAMIERAQADRTGRYQLMPILDLPRDTSWFSSGFRQAARPGDVAVLAGSPRILSNLAWMAQSRAGTVWWGQGWGPNTTPASARSRLRLANRCDVRLFYDESEADLIGHWSHAPTFYINNTLAYSSEDRLTLRTAASPRFCFLGRLTAKTNPERLVSIASILAQHFGAALRIGVVGDGPMRSQLEAQVQSAGLTANFTFHGAMFDLDAISEVLHEYTALLYPGAIGLTTQHALSEGLPVITHRDLNRHGPEARLLRDGENAWLCDDTDVALAQACLAAATQDDASFVQRQKRCRQVRTTHSIQSMADRFLAACESAVDQRRR